MKCGIELETLIRNEPINGVGSYSGAGTSVEELPTIRIGNGLHRWGACRDSSIESHDDDEHDCEFVSPMGCEFNTSFLSWIVDSVAEMKTKLHARVNGTCGMHFSTSCGEMKSQNVFDLLYVAKVYEDAFYGATGTTSRELGFRENGIGDGTIYAERLKGFPIIDSDAVCDSNFDGTNIWSRTCWLNLTNLGLSRHSIIPEGNRIENRVGSGTLNSEKIIALSNLWVSFYKTTQSVASKPILPMDFQGDGNATRCMRSLLEYVGWTNRGRRQRGTDYFVRHASMSRSNCVGLLMEECRKYDSRVQTGRRS